MKISILMSVYNGVQYLQVQLDSIRLQTRKPDEVVIIDDCSTDGSFDFISSYIDSYALFHWKLVRNKENKGWKHNFMHGIDLTSGDIVFFADQDDYWFPDKIQRYFDVFQKDAGISVLISPYTPWHGEEFEVYEMLPIYNVIRLNGNFSNFNITGSGCTLAFRKNYYATIRQYYVEGWAHDDFFRKIAQIDGSLAKFKSSSMMRRFHGSNASRKKRTYQSSLQGCLTGVEYTSSLIHYLIDLNDIDSIHENESFLIKQKKGYRERLAYFETGHLHYLLGAVLCNHRQYSRLRQIPGDFLLVYRHFRMGNEGNE